MNTFCPNYHYCFYNIKLFPYLKYIYCPPILFAIFCTFSIFDGQKCPTILGINVIYGNLGMFTVFFRQIMVMWELCIRNVICDYELSGPNPFNTTIKWYWAPEEQPPEPVEEEDEKAGAGTSGAEHSKSSNNNNICPTLRIYGIMDSGGRVIFAWSSGSFAGVICSIPLFSSFYQEFFTSFGFPMVFKESFQKKP